MARSSQFPYHLVTKVLPFLVFGVAVLVLGGWWLQSPTLVQLHPDFAPMQWNTALGFLLLSIAILLSERPGRRGASRVCASFVLGIAVLTLLQYLLHVNFGLDTFFVKPFVTTLTSHPGRMAPNTALAFCGLALAILLLLATSTVQLLFVAAALALGSLTLALSGLLGYALQLETIYGWSNLTRMAVHTAMLHTLLAVVIVARINTQLQRLFTSSVLLQTVSVLGVGTVISILLFFSAHTSESQKIYEILQREALLRRAAIQSTIDSNLQLLRATERFFASSGFVDREEFQRFTISFLDQKNAFLAIDWAPRIVKPERLAFEKNLQAFTSHGIRKLSASDPTTLVSHPGAEVYYPVQYVVPKAYAQEVLGFDHYADPLRTAIMDEAAHIGEPRSTSLLQLFRLEAGAGQREDFLVFVPSYVDGSLSLLGVPADDSQIRGFVIGAFRLSRLIIRALTSFPSAELHIAVYTTPARSERLAPQPALLLPATTAESTPTIPKATVTETLQIADKTLRIAFWPTASFLATHSSSYSTLIFFVTLGMTLGSAGYFYVIRRQQEALHETELRFRMAIEGADLGTWDWQPQTGITSFNERWYTMLGYTSVELGKDHVVWEKLIHPDDREVAFAALTEHVTGKTSLYRAEYRMRGKDGSWVWVLSAGQVVFRDSTGQPAQLVGIHLDITQMKEALLQALAATQAKSDFLASMSHEIRTPMNAILGMADLLSDTVLTLEQKDYVQRFKKAGEHLLTLINDILDLSKIEAGQLELDSIPFNLEDLVYDVGELMTVRAHSKGLELAVTIAPDVDVYRIGDPVRLRQVLLNLMGNAVKFTDSGEVSLRVEHDQEKPDALHCIIRDTGIGIPSEKLHTVFENFTQVDASITRRYGGTGLGLSISKRLVELMHGKLQVHSQVGVGSLFFFTAPFERHQMPSRDVMQFVPHLQGLRVLVIDDNATNRLILRETLEYKGIVVVESRGATEGLRCWEAALHEPQPFQLVLVDCQMPDKDGFYFVEQLRRIRIPHNTAILMLSSDNRPTDRMHCQELGVSQYLLKPVARATLWHAIAAALGQQMLAPQPVTRSAPPEDIERGLRILVAEDNEDNQMLIQAYLKKTPHRLTIAENGAVAVEYFRTEPYDLILMDVQMPVMDGYEATASIRQWEQQQQQPPTRIVALTANALTDDLQKSLAAGCDGHLTKPIKKAALLAAITDYASSLAPTT